MQWHHIPSPYMKRFRTSTSAWNHGNHFLRQKRTTTCLLYTSGKKFLSFCWQSDYSSLTHSLHYGVYMSRNWFHYGAGGIFGKNLCYANMNFFYFCQYSDCFCVFWLLLDCFHNGLHKNFFTLYMTHNALHIKILFLSTLVDLLICQTAHRLYFPETLLPVGLSLIHI